MKRLLSQADLRAMLTGKFPQSGTACLFPPLAPVWCADWDRRKQSARRTVTVVTDVYPVGADHGVNDSDGCDQPVLSDGREQVALFEAVCAGDYETRRRRERRGSA